jgi:uncharacterized protein (TIGR01370 family)
MQKVDGMIWCKHLCLVAILVVCPLSLSSAATIVDDAVLAAETKDEAIRHSVPFVYYLQNIDKNTLEQLNPAVAVVDPYDAHLTAEDIGYLKETYHQKIYAYLSAGEVDPSRRDEDDGYRYHYQWDVAAWLVNVPKKAQNNAQWGTKRVEYWDPEWIALMVARTQEAAKRGYTGVMLDTVDTFTAYEGLYKHRDVIADMACLVAAVRKAGKDIDKNFQVLINGGMELYNATCPSQSGDFLSLIDGQLKEDTWYNEKGSAKAAWTKDDLDYLKRAVAAGKPVFSIDYFTNKKITSPNKVYLARYFQLAKELGAIPYAADRELGSFLEQNRVYFKYDSEWEEAKNHGIQP